MAILQQCIIIITVHAHTNLFYFTAVCYLNLNLIWYHFWLNCLIIFILAELQNFFEVFRQYTKINEAINRIFCRINYCRFQILRSFFQSSQQENRHLTWIDDKIISISVLRKFNLIVSVHVHDKLFVYYSKNVQFYVFIDNFYIISLILLKLSD